MLRALPTTVTLVALLLAMVPPADASAFTVDILDHSFRPQTLNLTAGDTVVFRNLGAASHTATATGDPRIFDTGVLDPDESSTVITFPSAGVWSYACGIHPSMVGSIIVRTPASSNEPPAASFSIFRSGLEVRVNGSLSQDGDGTIVNWTWGFGDSTPAAYGVVSTHTYAQSGTYRITLTVRDDEGGTGVKEQLVQASPLAANQPPRANFSVTVHGLFVEVDGRTSFDPDGSTLIYSWDWGDRTTGSAFAVVNHTYEFAGVYTIRLTVSDGRGGTDALEQTVSATRPAAPNQQPRAIFIATPDGVIVNVDASVSFDPDGEIVEYHWDWGDGERGVDSRTTLHAYAAPGNYTVALTVKDDDGDSATAKRIVRAGPPPVRPFARIDTTASGLVVVVDASNSSGVDDEIVEYAWDFGDGARYVCEAAGTCEGMGPGETGSAGPARATHHYVREGRYTVTLRATDELGLSSEVSATVRPATSPPATFGVTLLGFDASADATGVVTYANPIYEWKVDGTTVATGARLHHRFAIAGPHEIRIVIIDAGGSFDIARNVIVVGSPTPTITTKEAPGAAFGALVALVGALALSRPRRGS